ncbi:MAG TPA: hypothetical protein VN428_13435, partial [Bryobacteraceae bacterium]|nr:hypothetical protein [Bryobacteraceae bacterium]
YSDVEREYLCIGSKGHGGRGWTLGQERVSTETSNIYRAPDSGSTNRGAPFTTHTYPFGWIPRRSCNRPASAEALFVATNLSAWRTDQPALFAGDVQLGDTAYRRLDPNYYAWLRSRMHLAKLAAGAGRLRQESFDGLRERFNAMHAWALEHIGEAALLAAVNTLNTRDYEPPSADPLPVVRRSPAAEALEQARALVDAIAERALALGWRPERLYEEPERGRPFADRGLVWLLRPGDRLGKVTRQSIEIIRPPDNVRLQFFNPDVDQPWIRRRQKTL